MRVIWRDGRVYGGSEAFRFLAWQFWFTIPLAIAFGLPGMKGLTNAVYRRLAKGRHCIAGGCSEQKKRPGRKWVSWAILAVLVGVAGMVGWAFSITPWVWMWVLAGALWLGFKCMNFRLEGGFRMVHSLYFVWVGTETKAFHKEDKAVAAGLGLGSSLVFVGFGLGALIGVVPQFNHSIAVGWLGIFSMLLLFHFGIFGIIGGILNSHICPKSPVALEARLKEPDFYRWQTRRAGTEARIAIVKNHGGGRVWRAKGLKHRRLAVGWSVLAHNLAWISRKVRKERVEAQAKAA